MWLGRPSSSQQVALIRGAIGAGRGDWPGHKFNGTRPAWPGHYFNGSGGGALGMYPWWPTGPWNGARLGAIAPASCRSGWREVQEELVDRGARLDKDGKICCGQSTRGFTGWTYNALSWQLGPGRNRLTMDPATILALIKRTEEPALRMVHASHAVAAWQETLGVEQDGCLGSITADALNRAIPSGWYDLTTDQITAALAGGNIPPYDPEAACLAAGRIWRDGMCYARVTDDGGGDGGGGDDGGGDGGDGDAPASASSGLSTAAKAGIAFGLLGAVGLVWAGSGRRKTRRGR